MKFAMWTGRVVKVLCGRVMVCVSAENDDRFSVRLLSQMPFY